MVYICRNKLSHTVVHYDLESIREHPILVWGSPYWFGDPRIGTGITKSQWGCA